MSTDDREFIEVPSEALADRVDLLASVTARRSFEEFVAGLSAEALPAPGAGPRPFEMSAEMLGLKVHTSTAVREREFVLLTDEMASFFDYSGARVRNSMSLLSPKARNRTYTHDFTTGAFWVTPDPEPLPAYPSLLDMSAAFPVPGVVS